MIGEGLIDAFADYQNVSDLFERLFMRALLDSYERIKVRKDLPNLIETRIRNYLVWDIENKNPILEPFLQKQLVKLCKENTLLPDPDQTVRTDIEFFVSTVGDFVVECKRLSSASKDYIEKGLWNFTEEKYSKDGTEAAMLAFVVGGNASKVFERMRVKVIGDRSFVCAEMHAELLCNGHVLSFHSLHSRKERVPILVHHLFLDIGHGKPGRG